MQMKRLALILVLAGAVWAASTEAMAQYRWGRPGRGYYGYRGGYYPYRSYYRPYYSYYRGYGYPYRSYSYYRGYGSPYRSYSYYRGYGYPDRSYYYSYPRYGAYWYW
jgi:hypothetical protein